jgi:hypothetical protein
MRGITISGTVYPQVQIENCEEGDLNDLAIVVEDAYTLLELATESEIDLIDIFNAVVETAKRERVTLPTAVDIKKFTDEDLIVELQRRLRRASNDS